MPCDPNCPQFTHDPSVYCGPNYNPSAAGTFASPGWQGFVKIRSQSLGIPQGVLLRANSADVNLAQDVTKPEVFDGRADPTVYQLGPKTVEGRLSLPIVADTTTVNHCPTAVGGPNSAAGQLLNKIWCWATGRSNMGRMMHDDMEMVIRYANHAAFKFDRVVADSLGISVPQSEAITMDLNVIGRTRQRIAQPWQSNPESNAVDFLAPARLLTWNDCTVYAQEGCWSDAILFYSNQVRTFNFELKNNAARFYTLNGSLFPMDINVGKREITGSVTLMGLADELRRVAEENQDHFTSKHKIYFGLFIGEDSWNGTGFDDSRRRWGGSMSPPSDLAIFYKQFDGVVFQIEELGLSQELFETTVQWHGMASDNLGMNYEAFWEPTSCAYPPWDSSTSQNP